MMSNYVVNDELIALNNRITKLSGSVRKVSQESDSLWRELKAKEIQYMNMLMDRGRLEERLRMAEEAFEQAKEKAVSEI